VKPNQISLAGIGIAAVGFACLFGASRGWLPTWPGMLAAAVCVQGRLMCNLLDGLVAVEGGLKSKGGELFNEIPDRIEDTAFLVGAGYLAGCAELGWACALLAVFTAYVRAFGASLGQGQDFGGPCAKPHRMFLLTLGLIVSAVAFLAGRSWNVLAGTLWLIAAGTALTAGLRIRRVYQKAK
jgi:phosphatidylglycerophosphate synthase